MKNNQIKRMTTVVVAIAAFTVGGLSLEAQVIDGGTGGNNDVYEVTAERLSPTETQEMERKAEFLLENAVAPEDALLTDETRREGERRDEAVDIVFCCGSPDIINGYTPAASIELRYIDMPDLISAFEMPWIVELDVHKLIGKGHYSDSTRYVLAVPDGQFIEGVRDDSFVFHVFAFDDGPFPIFYMDSEGHLWMDMQVIYEVVIDPFDKVEEGAGESNNIDMWIFTFRDRLDTPEIEIPFGFYHAGLKDGSDGGWGPELVTWYE